MAVRVKKLSEKEFTTQVMELLALHGWKAIHLRQARTKKGWRVAGQGDIIGWPDIFAVKGIRSLALELKVGKNTVTPAQDEWLSALSDSGVETYELHPDQWDSIVRLVK